MLKTYNNIYKFFWDGECVLTNISSMFIQDELGLKPKQIIKGNTFNELCELYMEWPGVIPYSLWSFKKDARIISFFTGVHIPDIKEKNPKHMKDFVFTIETKENRASIQKILEYGDSEKAIEYLKQHGMSVCPMQIS